MKLSFLSEFFNRFISNRGMRRHFRRLAMFDSFHGSGASKDIPASISHKLSLAATSTIDEVIQTLGSHEHGLTETQAFAVRELVGLNEIQQEKPPPWWMHLWRCYKTPFDILLTVLAIISYITEDMKATVVIGSMVFLSVLIRFWQERKSNKAADALKAMVSNTVTVIRRDPSESILEEAQVHFGIQSHPEMSERTEIPINQLVPGDIIALSAGDMIPADCRILSAKDLFVSQAAMTGESLPVEKFASPKSAQTNNPLEFENLAFMGTNVVSGTATAIAISTGDSTYFGVLAKGLTTANQEPTQFQMGVNKVAWLLIRFMMVMTPLVFFINGFTKGDWAEAFLFAMSVAVGLTPEMLPMIVTSTLAKGAVVLSKQKVIVKRLDAIQNFGAMDVLCTDKTGTLTQDKIFLANHTDAWGKDSDDVLEFAYLNSFYQTGLKNLLDVAVLEYKHVYKELNPTVNFHKIDEIPFDFQRRRMSVIVSNHEGKNILICKGAVEEILSICTTVQQGGHKSKLTPEVLASVKEVTAHLNKDGLRVVAVATKSFDVSKETFSVADESGLMLIGYVAFLDPPKESTAPALKALADHGVTVKVLTGDNELVTTKVCKEVGLDASEIILGSQIEIMDNEALSAIVESHHIFAKLTPAHKDRIVRSLKAAGHVVGFMGDGINDAPALRSADVGISVDTAVDIAKEAADIILLEKSLMVLEEGVIEGRKTFGNMLKYIKMTASSNFGNVFSVLIASAFIPFLPMLPMQLLVQNLLYDISQIAIPFDNVDPESVKLPQRWNPGDIGRFMVFFGPVSSIFDITIYCVMWFVFSANSAEHQSLFQSGWFVEGLMTQTLVVHMIRTRKIPFIQSRPGNALLAMTIAIMAAGIFLPMGPLAPYFKMVPLPLTYFPILGVILIGYIVLTQLMKNFYSKHFGWQ